MSSHRLTLGLLAQALTAFSLGLPAFVLIKAFSPGFFARKDTTTPVQVAVVSMILNVILAVFLMQFLAHVGIALATTITSWVNAFALATLLIRRGYFRFEMTLLNRLPSIVFSSLLMAVCLWFGVNAVMGIILWRRVNSNRRSFQFDLFWRAYLSICRPNYGCVSFVRILG